MAGLAAFADEDDAVVRQTAARLVRAAVGHDRYGAMLFGSRARRQASGGSDWDVAILFDDPGEAARVRRSLFRAFADYECDSGIHVDVVAIDPSTAPHMRGLLRNIDRDGAPL